MSQKMWVKYNPNPLNKHVGDCAIRAVSKATEQDWEKTYIDIAIQGLLMGDMPSSNAVWGEYLRSKGYERNIIPNECPDCYTLIDFCKENPKGTYVLALPNHAVCVVDGNYFDAWDSGNETPLYYWKRKEV